MLLCGFARIWVEAERRQVTVLFTDMVGFTSFSERAGEEAAFALMRSLSDLTDDAVHEHAGAVQAFTGDGIMAVFGAPVAYEDAPLRACRAAVVIQQNSKPPGPISRLGMVFSRICASASIMASRCSVPCSAAPMPA
jgi:class 3 adenylate cyclase